MENDCPVVGRFDFGNIAPVDTVGGIGGFVLGKQAEGGGDVFGKHGIAVVEFGFRVELECCRQSVFGKPEVFRQQAVHGEGFVPTVVREHVHGQRKDADFFVAFEGKRVERIKAALHRQGKHAAFGRVGIDVFVGAKVGGIFWLLPQTQTVCGKSGGSGEGKQQQDERFHEFPNRTGR